MSALILVLSWETSGTTRAQSWTTPLLMRIRPPGFTLINSHYRPSEDGAYNVLSQVYSDGLAHFSIFFEPIVSLEIESGRRQLGPTAVVSRKVVNDAQQVMVTVVGEIPIGSAERIALSMQIDQGRADD